MDAKEIRKEAKGLINAVAADTDSAIIALNAVLAQYEIAAQLAELKEAITEANRRSIFEQTFGK